MEMKKKRERKRDREGNRTNSREGIAGVGYEHASLSDSTISHCNTLDEPGCTHIPTISLAVISSCLFNYMRKIKKGFGRYKHIYMTE